MKFMSLGCFLFPVSYNRSYTINKILVESGHLFLPIHIFLVIFRVKLNLFHSFAQCIFTNFPKKWASLLI